MDHDPHEESLEFAPTSGRVMGVLTVLLGVVAVVVTVAFPGDYPVPVATGGLLVGVLAVSGACFAHPWLEYSVLAEGSHRHSVFRSMREESLVKVGRY